MTKLGGMDVLDPLDICRPASGILDNGRYQHECVRKRLPALSHGHTGSDDLMLAALSASPRLGAHFIAARTPTGHRTDVMHVTSVGVCHTAAKRPRPPASRTTRIAPMPHVTTAARPRHCALHEDVLDASGAISGLACATRFPDLDTVSRTDRPDLESVPSGPEVGHPCLDERDTRAEQELCPTCGKICVSEGSQSCRMESLSQCETVRL